MDSLLASRLRAPKNAARSANARCNALASYSRATRLLHRSLEDQVLRAQSSRTPMTEPHPPAGENPGGPIHTCPPDGGRGAPLPLSPGHGGLPSHVPTAVPPVFQRSCLLARSADFGAACNPAEASWSLVTNRLWPFGGLTVEQWRVWARSVQGTGF
jgi:hypothetical protein